MVLLEQIANRLKDGFQVNDLEWAARQLVQAANNALPGANGADKKTWVKTQILSALESVDHLIPVLGAWMDLPLFDTLQQQAVDFAVDKALGAVIEWAYATERIVGGI